MEMKDLSTLRKKDLKEEITNKQKKRTIQWRFYHSFLTLAMLIIILQLVWSSLINICKIISYKFDKIPKSKRLLTEAVKRNNELKEAKKNFTQYQIESIARNNLKMAQDGEILLVFGKTDEENEEPVTFWQKVLNFANKDNNNEY